MVMIHQTTDAANKRILSTKNFRDYFDIKQIKTTSEQPERKNLIMPNAYLYLQLYDIYT